MSDYTSTFTEGTGDTIDASDFSTEFDAIETASATKLDKTATSGDLTLSGTTVYPLIRETKVATTSGTTADFTGIPSWAKIISIGLQSVSTNGANIIYLRLGDSGGFESSAYSGVVGGIYSAGTTYSRQTSGFPLNTSLTGPFLSGNGELINTSGNIWTFSGNFSDEVTGTGYSFSCSGRKTLSATLDRIQLYISANAFDAGEVNIIYKG